MKFQEVSDVQRKIAKVEDELDITLSSTKDTAEKLELADKVLFVTGFKGHQNLRLEFSGCE